MKSKLLLAGVLSAASLFPFSASAETAKTYQVTGPVLEVSPTMIAVQKGKDRWEVARDGSTKMPADVKVGDKVTIEYTMSAKNIESKGGAKTDKTDKGAGGAAKTK
jgi:hypothetical protein